MQQEQGCTEDVIHETTVDQGGGGLNGSIHTEGLHLTGRGKGLEDWWVTSPDFKCESLPKRS